MHKTITYPANTIGDRLAAARKLKDLRQEDLSHRLVVSRSAVGQWEVGLTHPSVATIKRAAEILGVSPEWLAFGRTDPYFKVCDPGRRLEQITAATGDRAVRALQAPDGAAPAA